MGCVRPPTRALQSGPKALAARPAASRTRLPAVSRIKARSDLYEMDLTLDINVDVFPGAGAGGP